jgi:hypothetical protein
MFLLTLDESFSPCIHNDHGSSHRSVDVTSVTVASYFFQNALASVSHSLFALPHISISSLDISWCAGTWWCEKLIGSRSRIFLVAIIISKEFVVAVAFLFRSNMKNRAASQSLPKDTYQLDMWNNLHNSSFATAIA